MTDRPVHPHADQRLAAVERRLERRLPADPPAALRHRVLAAVDDALVRPRPRSQDDDLRIPGWAWAAAAALAIALTVPVVLAPTGPRGGGQRAVVARLRAAGVDDASLLAAVASGPRPHPAVVPVDSTRNAVPRGPRSRAVELRRLLEEML